MLELSAYDGIPHSISCITNAKKATSAPEVGL